jgi:hypothetical protein
MVRMAIERDPCAGWLNDNARPGRAPFAYLSCTGLVAAKQPGRQLLSLRQVAPEGAPGGRDRLAPGP